MNGGGPGCRGALHGYEAYGKTVCIEYGADGMLCSCNGVNAARSDCSCRRTVSESVVCSRMLAYHKPSATAVATLLATQISLSVVHLYLKYTLHHRLVLGFRGLGPRV